jgi:hypothetical protein
LYKAGFNGEYPEYIRSDGKIVHIIGIQLDKYGGGFFVNLHVFTEEQMSQMGWRELPWEERAIPLDVYFRQTARLRVGLFRHRELIRYGRDHVAGAMKLARLLPRAFESLKTLEKGIIRT